MNIGYETYQNGRQRKKRHEFNADSPLTLEAVFSRDNLYCCFDELRTQGGQAPGIDGITYRDISPREAGKAAGVISKSIQDGTYRPYDTRAVSIPKSSGKGTRTLKIGLIFDRVVSRLVLDALTPRLEAVFLDNSYGFRPGRGTWAMLAALEADMMQSGCFIIAIDDVRKAFDNVCISDVMIAHQRLLANRTNDMILPGTAQSDGHIKLPRGICAQNTTDTGNTDLRRTDTRSTDLRKTDKLTPNCKTDKDYKLTTDLPQSDVLGDDAELTTCDELRRFLGAMATILRGSDHNRQTGIDQGAPYSPAALNVLLHYVHDIHCVQDIPVEEQGYPLWYRYADNLAYICQSVSEGNEALEQTNDRLSPFGMELKGEDGVYDLTNGDTASLLGFSISYDGRRIRFDLGPKAWESLEEGFVKAHTSHTPTEMAHTVISGWIQSYGPAFENGESYVRRILNTASSYGFRETYSLKSLKQDYLTSHLRWQNTRNSVGLLF